MNTPYLKVEIGKNRQKLVDSIVLREEIDIETAISCFLLFTMKSMGYYV